MFTETSTVSPGGTFLGKGIDTESPIWLPLIKTSVYAGVQVAVPVFFNCQVLVKFSPGLKTEPSVTVTSVTNSALSVPPATGEGVGVRLTVGLTDTVAVIVCIDAVGLGVVVAGSGDGWLVAWALIRADAVEAAAVSTTAGSGTVGVGACSPSRQDASIKLVIMSIPHMVFLVTNTTTPSHAQTALNVLCAGNSR